MELDKTQWKSYIYDTWSIFPIYTFYEINYSKLPWNLKDRLFIYSNISSSNIEIKEVLMTNFFFIYECYISNLTSSPIGFVFQVRNVDNDMRIRCTTHTLSICTNYMTRSEAIRLEQKIIYDKNEISVISYGNDAEVITDLTKIMGVSIE